MCSFYYAVAHGWVVALLVRPTIITGENKAREKAFFTFNELSRYINTHNSMFPFLAAGKTKHAFKKPTSVLYQEMLIDFSDVQV